MAMSGLFRIECLVESRQLGQVLIALAGKVKSMSPPQPVVETPGTQVKGIELVNLLAEWIKQRRLHAITPSHAREFLAEHGKPTGSYSYILNNAREVGLLKNNGNGQWVVVASKKRTGTRGGVPRSKRDYAAEYRDRKKRERGATTAAKE